MNPLSLVQPAGVRDQWGIPLAILRKSEQRFLSLLADYGYTEVATPILENLGLIAQADVRLEQRGCVKLIDQQGQILTLRPDMTVPIARLIATHLHHEPLPHRLGYWASVYRVPAQHEGLESEFIQAGAELVGVGGPEADAEMIALAGASLRGLGLNDFILEIGQAGFFHDLIEGCGLELKEQERIRHLVDTKNNGALRLYLNQLSLAGGYSEALAQLPQLYGTPAAVMAAASKLVLSSGMEKALADLNKTLELLNVYGLADQIRLDLGLVPDLNYYTGIVIRGLSPLVGTPVLSGGRYDRLLAKFGLDLPATGFAIHMGRVLQALWREPSVIASDLPLTVVANTGDTQRAWQLVQSLRSDGYASILSLPNESIASPWVSVGLEGCRLTWGKQEVQLPNPEAVIQWMRAHCAKEGHPCAE